MGLPPGHANLGIGTLELGDSLGLNQWPWEGRQAH